MIDVHCHILPYIDDGAPNWDEAMEMAKQAVDDGITHVVATPHHANGKYENAAFLVTRLVEEFNHRVQDAGLNLLVLPGQEVRVHNNLLSELDHGELLPLNGSRYLLLELPSTRVPAGFEEMLYELSLLGIQVVIAHPERNQEIADHPELLQRFVASGALAQITGQSLTGGFGRKIQKVCMQFCQMNLAHLIATDAHDTHRRPFSLSKAYQMIGKELGEELEDYFRGNARKIIDNTPITQIDSSSLPSRRVTTINRLFSVFHR